MIGSIDQAFEDLKDRIRARFLELWQDLKDDWEASGVGTLIADLKEKWEESALKEWWDEFVLDISEEGLKPALENLWFKIINAVQNWLDSKESIWANVWRAFTQEGIDDGTGKVNFWAALGALWPAFMAQVTQWLQGNNSWWANVWRAWTQGGVEDGTGRVDFGAALTTLWEEIKAGLIVVAGKFGYFLATTVLGLLSGDQGQGGHSFWSNLGRSFVAGLVIGVLAKMSEVDWAAIGRRIKDGLVSGISGLAEALKGGFNKAIWFVERSVNAIIDGVNAAIRALRRIPGMPWVNTIGGVTLPRLAQGGLVTATEQLALLHGPEVVIPLDDPKTIGSLREALGDAGTGGTTVVVHNHFGQGSVRSNRDILRIADDIQHSLRLAGVKVAM